MDSSKIKRKARSSAYGQKPSSTKLTPTTNGKQTDKNISERLGSKQVEKPAVKQGENQTEIQKGITMEQPDLLKSPRKQSTNLPPSKASPQKTWQQQLQKQERSPTPIKERELPKSQTLPEKELKSDQKLTSSPKPKQRAQKEHPPSPNYLPSPPQNGITDEEINQQQQKKSNRKRKFEESINGTSAFVAHCYGGEWTVTDIPQNGKDSVSDSNGAKIHDLEKGDERPNGHTQNGIEYASQNGNGLHMNGKTTQKEHQNGISPNENGVHINGNGHIQNGKKHKTNNNNNHNQQEDHDDNNTNNHNNGDKKDTTNHNHNKTNSQKSKQNFLKQVEEVTNSSSLYGFKVPSWDDTDAAAEEASLRQPLLDTLATKKKKYDEYNLEYDKGATKKKKVKRDLFADPTNLFQIKVNSVCLVLSSPLHPSFSFLDLTH